MNNMGAMNRKQIMAFAMLVLADFHGWQIRWTTASPSICIRDRKIIFIEERWINKYPWEVKEVILHEVAHISTLNDYVHGVEFYKEYIRLLNRHMLNSKDLQLNEVLKKSLIELQVFYNNLGPKQKLAWKDSQLVEILREGKQIIAKAE